MEVFSTYSLTSVVVNVGYDSPLMSLPFTLGKGLDYNCR